MLTIPEKVVSAVEQYEEKYRRPGLPELDWSEVYDLFPKQEVSIENKWPAEWPHSKRAGVYFVFAENGMLLYVGKASVNHCIGKRLSSYFATDRKTEGCEILQPDGSEKRPRYVAALAVPRGMSFEAAAIEEYLVIRSSR
jgi:hypothetical protein